MFGVKTKAELPCVVVAVLLHYFTLTSVAWMGVEAINMYLLFVKVVGVHISKFMWKSSVAAWGELDNHVALLSVQAKYGIEKGCETRYDLF